MMKLVLGVCLVAFYALPGYAQGASSSIQVSTAVEAPESSIDLLKKSIRSSGSQIDTVGTPAKKKKKAVQPAKQAPATQPSPAAPAVTPQPAEPVVQTPVAQPSVAKEAAQPGAPSQGTVLPATKDTVPAVEAPSPRVDATPVSKPVAKTATPQPTASKRKVKRSSKPATRKQLPASKPTVVEQQVEQANALAPASSQQPAAEQELEEEEAAADAELEYAVKMLEASKAQAEAAGRKIPPPAAKNRPKKVPSPNKKFNPNAFRPGVEWLASKSTHFDIYTQKRTAGVPSSNMSMNFESSYQTLRRFIPWMMAGRVRVFVYQDHDSYLRYEPDAKAWTRAVAYPTRGEIVVYDEPGKARELKEVFTHELTHIFTQQFFDSHQTGRIMTPLWLDEGLAVFMEDQALDAQGGEWAKDFKTLNFQRDPSQTKPSFASSSMFGSSAGKKFASARQGKPLYFTPFGKFMDENSLHSAEGANRVQDWYFQAYTMVRFLLNPAGGTSPSNRMQFEQFTRLIAQGEAVRNPATGFLVKDARGKTVYEPYSVEKALGRAYRYNTVENFEDAFWRWAK